MLASIILAALLATPLATPPSIHDGPCSLKYIPDAPGCVWCLVNGGSCNVTVIPLPGRQAGVQEGAA